MKPFHFPFNILLTVALLFLASCAKDETTEPIDTTAPIITLNGNSEITIELQENYIELDATAIDDEDGEVTVEISGTVNNDLKGQYIITYTATDGAGNIASEERIVNVVNSADLLAGAYFSAIDNCNSTPQSSFDATVTSSNTVNGVFTIANFGAFGTAVNVELTYNKQNQTITAVGGQSLGLGVTLASVTNGQLLSQSPVSFSIGYTWIDTGGATDFCSSTYTK